MSDRSPIHPGEILGEEFLGPMGISQSRLARRYGWGLANGRTVADIEAWPERLGQVTTEDVARDARKYLDKTHSVTGLLLPKKNELGKAGNAPGQNKS